MRQIALMEDRVQVLERYLKDSENLKARIEILESMIVVLQKEMSSWEEEKLPVIYKGKKI